MASGITESLDGALRCASSLDGAAATLTLSCGMIVGCCLTVAERCVADRHYLAQCWQRLRHGKLEYHSQRALDFQKLFKNTDQVRVLSLLVCPHEREKPTPTRARARRTPRARESTEQGTTPHEPIPTTYISGHAEHSTCQVRATVSGTIRVKACTTDACLSTARADACYYELMRA